VKSDKLFSAPLQKVSDFSFDRQVAQVFPDMINRSIPGYAIMIQNIGELAKTYAQNDSIIYDLGCATGISTLSVARSVSHTNCSVVGVDNSEAMLEKCQAFVDSYQHDTLIELVAADIVDYALQPCSVVVMHFTLQFIKPEVRAQVLQGIYDALLPGGVLILSEKIKAPSVAQDELLIDLHHNFKRDNGYSELEISQKRTALENVMLLDSLEAHQTRLGECGFERITPWYQCFNFVSMVAFKPHTASVNTPQ
jgi:tRNA (cmo5U34)-methyltransferase